MWSIHKCYFEIRLSYIVHIYNSTNNNAVVNLDKNKYGPSICQYMGRRYYWEKYKNSR